DMLAQAAVAYAYLGDAGRGIAAADTAIRLNPFHDDWYFASAAAPRLIARDMPAMVDLAGRAPDATTDVRAFIAIGHALQGRPEEARRERERFLDHFRRNVVFGRTP